MSFVDKDLLSMQEARILMEDAREAREIMLTFPQERLDAIVDSLANAADQMIEELTTLSIEETGYGKQEDRLAKNRFICQALPKKLKSIKSVGILEEDSVEKMMEVGVPIGVLVSMTSAFNPVSTAVYQVLIAIKSGNPIVFIPDERAVKVTSRLVDRLSGLAVSAGLPEGSISSLRTVTRSGILEMLEHEATAMVINTGVDEYYQEAAKSGKAFIHGGMGNSPVFIERTADIKRAVRDILLSRSFDHGLLPGAEQFVVVDRQIAEEVKTEMIEKGAYFMTEEDEKKLVNLLYPEKGRVDLELMGKSAAQLATRAGFSLPDQAQLLVSEQQYISDQNPFATKLPCPVIAYYIENDWHQACEKCMGLLVKSHGHTLVIHSKDEEVIKQFALKKPTGRVLVNTAAALGSMGVTTNLFPAMTLGSITAGRGISVDNLSPMNLIYRRKVGYGVREPEEIFGRAVVSKSREDETDLKELLKQILETMSKN